MRNVGSECGKGDSRVERVEMDAFGDDHGYSVLKRHLGELVAGHNVILCSFGPKPSAIALYRLQREFAEVALAQVYQVDRPFGRFWAYFEICMPVSY